MHGRKAANSRFSWKNGQKLSALINLLRCHGIKRVDHEVVWSCIFKVLKLRYRHDHFFANLLKIYFFIINSKSRGDRGELPPPPRVSAQVTVGKPWWWCKYIALLTTKLPSNYLDQTRGFIEVIVKNRFRITEVYFFGKTFSVLPSRCYSWGLKCYP